MSWLTERMEEILDLLRQQSVLVGPMADDSKHMAIEASIERKVAELVHTLAALDGVVASLACRGEQLLASDGPLIDYVELSEATHAARWALDKVAGSFELGAIFQTVVVGSQQKLILLGIGSITLAILAPADLAVAEILSQAN